MPDFFVAYEMLHVFSEARVRSQPLVQCGFVGVF